MKTQINQKQLGLFLENGLPVVILKVDETIKVNYNHYHLQKKNNLIKVTIEIVKHGFVAHHFL